MTIFKKGDRVEILSSVYQEHPSRMAGGTGTVVEVDDDFIMVCVDGCPTTDTFDAWTFYDNELRRTNLPVVVKPKPREFWINTYHEERVAFAYTDAALAAQSLSAAFGGRTIHVREVTEG